ncbi:MAG TPA: hypothetical protein VK152_06715 [Paludibacter sp.]|nr:hypothetical protein [Paludibacter sp.]
MKKKYSYLTRKFRSLAAFLIRTSRYYDRHPEPLEQLQANLQRMCMFCLVLAFMACNSSKKITKTVNNKTQVQTETRVQTETKASGTGTASTASATEATKQIEAKQTENTETVTVHTLFDTTKPTPTIKEQTTTTNRRKSESESRELEQTRAELSVLISENWKLKAELDSVKNVKSKTVTVDRVVEKEVDSSWWKWYLAGIISTILIYLFFKFKVYRLIV